MAGILFLVEIIYCNQIRCIYLKNKNVFVISFVDFENLHEILTFSTKNDPHSLCISEITDSERRV